MQSWWPNSRPTLSTWQLWARSRTGPIWWPRLTRSFSGREVSNVSNVTHVIHARRRGVGTPSLLLLRRRLMPGTHSMRLSGSGACECLTSFVQSRSAERGIQRLGQGLCELRGPHELFRRGCFRISLPRCCIRICSCEPTGTLTVRCDHVRTCSRHQLWRCKTMSI